MSYKKIKEIDEQSLKNYRFTRLFGMTARHIENYIYKLLQPYGLGFEQTGMLFLLSCRKDLQLNDIVKESLKDKTTISRVISSLEKKGFITKTHSHRDKRIVYINITQEGKDKLQELTDSTIFSEAESIFTNALTTEEQEIFKQCLTKILKGVL